jgi:hypothetical protein
MAETLARVSLTKFKDIIMKMLLNILVVFLSGFLRPIYVVALITTFIMLKPLFIALLAIQFISAIAIGIAATRYDQLERI